MSSARPPAPASIRAGGVDAEQRAARGEDRDRTVDLWQRWRLTGAGQAYRAGVRFDGEQAEGGRVGRQHRTHERFTSSRAAPGGWPSSPRTKVGLALARPARYLARPAVL